MNKLDDKYIDKYQSRTKKILCISSKTKDDKHILIWDFDNIDYYHVLKSLSKSQSFYGLGIIYIFKSEWGFNAICLDKFDIKEAYHIKFYTRFSDYSHTNIGYKQGNWSWKVNSDKEYVKKLMSTDSFKNRIGSNAHKLFLEKQFNLKINFGMFDSLTDVDFESYKQDVI